VNQLTNQMLALFQGMTKTNGYFFCSHTWKNSGKNNPSFVFAHFLRKCLLFVLDLTIFSPSDDQ